MFALGWQNIGALFDSDNVFFDSFQSFIMADFRRNKRIREEFDQAVFTQK